MSPTARKVARLAGELDSVSRRLKNLVPELQELEFDRKALAVARAGSLGMVERVPVSELVEEVKDIFEVEAGKLCELP
jgi:uncharacterized protein (UPF0335 family)